jgi:apolipoprotein D and lipocalin family protein
LKVRFAPGFLTWLPFVWADYWVLSLDDAYTVAAVGTPDRDYLWILSRTPQLDDGRYQAVVARVAAMGYPVDELERTRQAR